MKTAVVIERNKAVWLLAGQWSAGERFPKRPKSLKKLAAQEGFDPARTSAVWLQPEQQVGWFAFDGKPVKGAPLAPVATRQVDAAQWPWYGLFKLDADLWWMVVTDAVGAIHPFWDVVGSKEEIDRIFDDRVAELAPIQHYVRIESEDQAWSWLLQEKSVIRSVPAAAPVNSAEQAARRAALVGAPLALAAVGAAVGLKMWKDHRAALAQQLAQQQALLQQRAQMNESAAKAAKEAAMVAQIKQQWAQTPRPWVGAYSWAQVIQACTIGPLSQEGWGLQELVCTPGANGLEQRRTWVRLPQANVLKAPEGVLDPQGNTVVQTTLVPMPPAAGASAAAQKESVSRWWLGMTQKWAGILTIKADTFSPYRPPLPPNTPPDIQQKVGEPPILWWSSAVSIDSPIAVDPRWSFLQTQGFVPTSLTIQLGASGMHWILKGAQYVNP